MDAADAVEGPGHLGGDGPSGVCVAPVVNSLLQAPCEASRVFEGIHGDGQPVVVLVLVLVLQLVLVFVLSGNIV